MLYSQILYFILVMVVFESYQPGPPDLGLGQSLLACGALVVWLWLGCRLMVWWFLRRLAGNRPPRDPAASARRLGIYLQALAVLVQVVMITVLELKAHLFSLPVMAASQTLPGLVAAGLFLALASLVWSETHPLERRLFAQDLERATYVRAQLRFVGPVLLPWFMLVLLADLITLLWPDGGRLLDTSGGELAFLGLFALITVLIFPPLVRTWWGCRPVGPGPVREVAQEVLKAARVSMAGIYYWPAMAGRMLTAGVVGVVPGLRYLLITPALAQALSVNELAAVVAHEAGHVRHRHMALYLGLFMGFFLAAFALSGPISLALNWLIYLLAGTNWGAGLLAEASLDQGLLSLALALPLALLLILYLRFVVGFFMRNYERQADLFALRIMGSAEGLVGALEKIARLAGNVRDLPSWHHYSVAQRIEALDRAQLRPGLIQGHSRRMRRAAATYLVVLALATGLGLAGEGFIAKPQMDQATLAHILEQQIARNPHDPSLLRDRALLRFQQGQEAQALADLRRALVLEPHDPETLNNLAWILATAKDHSLRSPRRAVELALRAVALSPQAHIWDTLAEAYFISGRADLALAAARSALAAGPRERPEYYQRQLERFKAAAKASPGQR